MPDNPVPIVNVFKLLPNATPEMVLLVSLVLAILPANMVFVTLPVSPVVTTVPVTAGIVRVLVPAVAAGDTVMVPDVEPLRNKLLPEAISMCSELVQAPVEFTQLNVLSVVPFNVIPPLSAVVLEGDETAPNSIFLSSTEIVVELIVVVVPFTVKSPLNVKLAALTVPVNVGLAENTKVPVPVSSVTAARRFALVGVAKNVATPVPNPEIPVDTGRPVQFDKVPDVGVPRTGVTSVGVLANTKAPVPVSSESTPANSDDDVEANALRLFDVYATVPPAPNATELESVPVSVNVLLAVNVLPSAMVNVADVAGAVMATLLTLVAVATPNVGVTSVGVLANTNAPVPVSSVTAANRLALDGVAKNVATPVPNPEIPVDTGSPEQLVNVPELGVPNAPPLESNVADPEGTVNVEFPDVVNVKLWAFDIVRVAPATPTFVIL